MQVHISPSMRRITISTTNGFLDPMKIKGVARYLSYRCLFWSILVLAFIFPLLFITTALVTLEGASKCATPYCMGRKFGPTPYWGGNRARRRMEELYSTLLDSDKIPLEGLKIPNNIEELVSDAKANNYDVKAIMLNLKAMVDVHEERARAAKLQEALYRHFASSGIPKGMYCLSLKLTAEYSTNALARQELPSPDLAPRLTDNSYHHLVVATDNVLAASVVVSSAIKNSADPEKVVFHIITDKKTFAAMHAWFSLNPMSPAIVEVKGVHQFSWLTKDHVPVLDAIENSRDIKQYYHGDHAAGADMNVSSSALASKLQARSPKYISIMNHLRIYLPELFPALNKVVFLDDDVVVQRDLSPLWDIDLHGKVNGAVETCKGEDKWVMSKTFKNYFNFSHPMVNQRFDADRCAWAYGMNVFDLQAWRLTDITTVYHFWQKQNLRQNLTLWRLGTLPPALIAFDGYVHPIDSSWHMLGLGYHPKSNVTHVQQSAVIHYNGQAKPWLDIAFPELRHFWTKYVDYSNEFIRQCNILES